MRHNKRWQQYREMGTLIHCREGIKVVQLLWKNLAVPQNFKHTVTIRPENFTPTYISKRIENLGLYTKLDVNDHSSIFHHSQKGRDPKVNQLMSE